MRCALALALLAGLGVSAFATDAPSLRQTIREDLLARPYLRPGWIRLGIERRTVTLRGRVPDELTRALVLTRVRNIPGVSVVKDALSVDPSLGRWKPSQVERARQRLEDARKLVRGDEELGRYTTLHVSRTRYGVAVTGAIASASERARLRKLIDLWPDATVALRVTERPDAPRRAGSRAATDEPTRAFARSVTEAIAREPLLAGRVLIEASVERDELVLRGIARDLPAHDLAVEIARGLLLAREREAESARARSGELTRLLAGDLEAIEGSVPGSLDSLVFVIDPVASDLAR